MNRIAFGASEFLIAFSLGQSQGNAILESVRLLPSRRFDRDSKIWKAPEVAAPQVKALAERYAFDVTAEAKVLLDAVAPIEATAVERRIVLNIDRVEFLFPYDEAVINDLRSLPGRSFDPERKVWSISADSASLDLVPDIARRYGFRLSSDLERFIAGRTQRVTENRAISRSLSADIEIPTLSGELRPFQKAGVVYALRAKRLIIGDPVGLGKTAQALATIEAAGAYPCLFVCKPVAKWQMEDEVKKWLPQRSVIVLTGERPDPIKPADVTIIPWSVLDAWKDELAKTKWASIIPDELHLAKERKAKRTQAIKALAKGVEYRIGLTATDIKSRPSELISQLEVLDRLDDLGGWYTMVTRYCDGYKDKWGAWQIKGASNIEELHDKMRAVCYVRREKSDVLTELPPVIYTPVPLDLSNRSAYQQAESDVAGWLADRVARAAEIAGLSPEDQRDARIKAQINAERMEQLLKFGVLKQVAAQGKMPAMTEWLNEFLDSSDEKIIVFTEYRDTTEELAEEFDAPTIYGGMSDRVRERNKNMFQSGDARILIANYTSAGESLTLTAAQHVAFAGLPWTPADVDQAIGRAYGRLNDVHGVTAWWLIARGTIEEDIVAILGYKRGVVSKVVAGTEAIVTESAMLRALTARLVNRAA